MIYLGPHVSIAGGVHTAPQRAVELGATALGLFTKNQRQWASKPLPPDEIAAFRSGLEEAGITEAHAVIHASYLINIGNPDPQKRQRSVDGLLDECTRAEQLGLSLVNFHPGSGMGDLDDDQTISLIAEGCRSILERTESATLVLEATAGQGSHVGYRFGHLGEIIRRAGNPRRMGVCIDSCHIFAAGYDVRSAEAYTWTMDELEREVGFDRLVAVHLNDAKIAFGSRKDRHELIGEGTIGLAGLANFVRDPRLAHLPFVLETPDPDRWKQEIELVRRLAEPAGRSDAHVSASDKGRA